MESQVLEKIGNVRFEKKTTEGDTFIFQCSPGKNVGFLIEDAPLFTGPFTSYKNFLSRHTDMKDYVLYEAVQNGERLAAVETILIPKENVDPKSKRYADEVSLAAKEHERFENAFKDPAETYTVETEKEENDAFTEVLTVKICRNGKLGDYFDRDEVLSFYEGQKVTFDFLERGRIAKFMEKEIRDLVNDSKHDFLEGTAPEELVISGMLFGIPIEATATEIKRNRLVSIKKCTVYKDNAVCRFDLPKYFGPDEFEAMAVFDTDEDGKPVVEFLFKKKAEYVWFNSEEIPMPPRGFHFDIKSSLYALIDKWLREDAEREIHSRYRDQ